MKEWIGIKLMDGVDVQNDTGFMWTAQAVSNKQQQTVTYAAGLMRAEID